MNSRNSEKRPNCRPSYTASLMERLDYDRISRALHGISSKLDNFAIPSGYYYVILDDVNNVLALISYIALRSKATICGLSDDRDFDEIQYLLAKTTGLTVNNCGLDNKTGTAYKEQKVSLQSSGIYLRSRETCHKYWKASADNCLVCWGPPKDIRQWLGGCTGQSKRVCVILTTIQYEDMVQQQPITTCYLKPCPSLGSLNNSLQDATPHCLVTIDPQDEVRGLVPEPLLIHSPRAHAGQRSSITSHLPISCPLPEGHYHIILNDPLDTIPLIAYLALHSTRTICYLDAHGSWDRYRELLHRATGIETMHCAETLTARIKAAMQKFKSSPKAIMLRPAGNVWNVCFRKSLADCVIYCGVPGNTREFQAKTTHSYLIVSLLQSTTQMRHEPPGVSQHPSTNHFNNDMEGSVLHELRLKTEIILKNLGDLRDLRISGNQHKSPVSRQQKIPTSYISRPSSSSELSHSLQDFVPRTTKAAKNQLYPKNLKAVRIHLPALQMTTLPLSRPLVASGFPRTPNSSPPDATHYYIIVNDINDSIPLIAYLAQRSKKTVCGLPADRSLEKTQKLLEHTTDLNVTFCDSNDKQCLRDAAQMFRKQSSGILLRPNKFCYASLRWSGAACLVHWGPLPNIRAHVSRCLDSVTHTYVILTKAQFDQMQDRQRKWLHYLKEHPASKQLNNVFQDSPLHGFRAKLKSPPNGATTSIMDPFIATHERLVSIKSHNLLSDPQLLPWSGLNSWEIDPLKGAAWESKMGSWDDMSFDEFSDLRSILRTYPKLPSGRNYIVMDQTSDVVPFSACMALQSDKTICIIGEHMSIGFYAKIFELVTELEVLYYKGTDETDSVEVLLEVLRLKNSPGLLLLSQEAATKYRLSSAKPDCVLFWGLPPHFPHYFKEVSSLHPTARSCLVLTPGQEAEGLKGRHRLNKGIICYPNASVKNYLGPDSPFRDVRLRAFQALSSIMISSPSVLNHSGHNSGDTGSESGSDEEVDWRDPIEGSSDVMRPRPDMVASEWRRARRAHDLEEILRKANEGKQARAQQSKDFRKWVRMNKLKPRLGVLRKAEAKGVPPQSGDRFRSLL